MSNHDVVENFERSWAERDPAAMVACFAPNGTYTAPGAPGLTGTAIGEFAALFFAAFPDCTYGWKVVAREGDVVAAQWTFTGTMTGALLGIEPTGGRAGVRGAHVIRLAGGQLAAVEAYWDNQGFFEQLGIKG
ncbi:MAG: ester cyclase [Sporichthyaceae bacterium]